MSGHRAKKVQQVYSEGFLRELEKEQTKWEIGRVAPSLKAKPELKDRFMTGSGEFEVKRLYTPADLSGQDYITEVGFSGQYPFTRGIYETGMRAREWKRMFYVGFGSAENANERARALVKAGADYIHVAMDLPTQIGLDSDHPMALGEVGKAGVALDTLEDLERYFEDIPLGEVSSGTVGNCISPWVLAMFYALLEKRGIDPAKVMIKIQNDPIKEFSGRGTQIFPLDVSIDLATDVIAFCIKHLPLWTPHWSCTTTMRWGGCNATQEVAFGIADLLTFVEAAKKKGVPPELMIPKVELKMSTDNDLFEEVSKFRATRRLWAKICRERLQTEDPRVLALRLATFQTATRLTAQQPMNNIIRTAIHVLAAILGGVYDRIDTAGYDEALALPTFESTWLSNLTKNILIDEHMVGNTIDPLGGSYYVETLTNQIEEKAFEYFKKIEEMGGAVTCIKKGVYLQEMAKGMYQQQQEIERGERIVIGVNKFQLEEEEEPETKIFYPDPQAEKRQIERLRGVKARRNNEAVSQCLVRIKEVAEKKASGQDENIVPSMIDAVKAYASIGEIFDVLREIFGEFSPEASFWAK